MAHDKKSALYPWFAEHGAHWVYPDDLQPFITLRPYGKVFTVVMETAGMTVLEYGSARFRVKPGLLQPVPATLFSIRQSVLHIQRQQLGEITDIIWHYKESRPFYRITVGGRKISRRFWESELLPAPDAPES